MNESLKKVDQTILYLVRGLQERNLLSCINLLLLADHGMADAGAERVIKPQEFVPDIDKRSRFWNGVFPRFEPLSNSQSK